jgi:hypothetical protein
LQPPSHGGHEVRGPRRLLWRLRHGATRHDWDSIPPTDPAIPYERAHRQLRRFHKHQQNGDADGDDRKEQDVQPSLAIPPLTTPPQTTVWIADRCFPPSTDALSASCLLTSVKQSSGVGPAEQRNKVTRSAPRCLVRGSRDRRRSAYDRLPSFPGALTESSPRGGFLRSRVDDDEGGYCFRLPRATNSRTSPPTF